MVKKHKRIFLLINLVLISLGLGLVAGGVFINFRNLEKNTNITTTATVVKLGNGLEGNIYLENSDLSEDVESNISLEINKADVDLRGFSLELTTPSDLMLYCNDIAYTAANKQQTNSYICNVADNTLTMTLDVQPSPPFTLKVSSLNRKAVEQLKIDYKINNSDGVVNQGQIQVVNKQSTSSLQNSIDWKLIWYIVSGVYIVVLLGYLIIRKKVVKE